MTLSGLATPWVVPPVNLALLAPMLEAALQHGRLSLSGVSDAVRDAAMAVGSCRVKATRPAPYAALEGVTAESWLAQLGASTRYQLRRSRRRYEADGPLVVQRAACVAEGQAFLTELASLHQVRWTARNAPGAFAEPAFTAFHRALIDRGLPRGEVDLIRVSVPTLHGSRVIGLLYNLRWQDRIYAYQGGFDYAAGSPHEKPGLTCHHAAIEGAIASRMARYDFLAGEARYKTNLGNGDVPLHWLELRQARMRWDISRRTPGWLRSWRRPAPVTSSSTRQ